MAESTQGTGLGLHTCLVDETVLARSQSQRVNENLNDAMGWINVALAGLPGTDDALFQKVWKERRLLFDGQQGVGDAVDYYSALLVAAAIRRGAPLLVTLPDFQPHRPAFLFATALIRHFLDSRSPNGAFRPPSGPVLYFGPTVGIRDQLHRTSILQLQLNLAEVFSQEDISRGAAGISRAGSTARSASAALPRVVTVYAPADPVEVVRAYRPCWIALDCGDEASLIWLRPLLEETTRQGIPIIAWGQNPLAECVADFASFGHAFSWPPVIQPPGCLLSKLNDNPDDLLHPTASTHLSPLVLDGGSVRAFSALLRDAGQLLVRTGQQLGGPFGTDAVAVHWKYLRSLETLTVPVDFYEAEAPRFWGLRSFVKLGATCDHFRAACMQTAPRLYRDLEDVAVRLDEAKTNLESHGCALWDALTNICLEDSASDVVRLLVFPSDSRKQLFLFAMLSRHNTTEDDLREMRTHVVSLRELRRWMHSRQRSSGIRDTNDLLMPSENAIWHPVVVGLPGPGMTPRLLCAFLHPQVDVVLYPHQCPTFMRRQAEWSFCMSGDISRNIGALVRISGIPKPSVMSDSQLRLVVEQPTELNVETTTKKKSSATGSIWSPENAVSEVARLFQFEEDTTAEEVVFIDQADAGTATQAETAEEIWCAEAVNVQFDQGWRAYFAHDDIVNVVRDGALDQRYVRSLRVGERVVLIHGQQRQSLYDLIISRVHKHPSIELHLALIRRWQEDVRVAFGQWRARIGEPDELMAHGARDLNGLLQRIQARGSQLVSTLTLSFWLRGFVLCPLDPEDLRRVAEVLDIGFVRQHYTRIAQAANRLRGLHRSLSHKLNRWLQDHAAGVVHKDDDDVIDAELGLTFGDVRNSLLVLRVVRIDTVTGPFLRSNLGRAQKGT